MAMTVDIVCGVKIKEENAVATSEYLAKTYYFCSQGCKHKFDQDPESYLVKTRSSALSASIDEETA